MQNFIQKTFDFITFVYTARTKAERRYSAAILADIEFSDWSIDGIDPLPKFIASIDECCLNYGDPTYSKLCPCNECSTPVEEI